MKKKITNNLGLKIFSVILASMIWLIIINLADPVKRRTISGIDVELRNPNALSNQWVFEVVEGKTVDFEVVGKRSIVDSLQKSDFIAFSDLSNLSKTNAAPINVELKRYFSDSPEIIVNQMLKISLEKVESKNVNVNVDAKGKVDEDYHLGKTTPKPLYIQVRGGKSTVERIDTVRVEVDVSGADKNFKENVPLKAYDKDMRLIESNTLTFHADGAQIDTVTVTVQILKKKSIEVRHKVVGTPADGYVLTNTEVVPNQISIAGTAKELNKIDYIEIPIDVDQATSDVEINYDNPDIMTFLKGYDVKLVEEDQPLTIKAVIEPLVTRALDFTQQNIQINNQPINLMVSFLNMESKYTLVLRGLKKDVDALSINTIKCFIDLKGLKKGKHKLTLQYEIPENVTRVSNDYEIEIELDSMEEPNDENIPPSNLP